MFCPSCGNAEQRPDAYCRSCGEFIPDFSNRFYLISRIFGARNLEKQVNVNLIINLLTALASSLLLAFLIGYYDAQYERTHAPTPPIVYLVYLFLGLISVWQILSFMIALNLKSKLSGRRDGKLAADQTANESVVLPANAKESLPPADIENTVPTSVVENTTKIFDKLPRQ